MVRAVRLSYAAATVRICHELYHALRPNGRRTAAPHFAGIHGGIRSVQEGGMSALTEFDDVTVESRGHVAIIRLNDPKALNAISPRMMGGLLAALTDVEKEASAFRCAILTGTGRGFCSGANLTTTGPDDILKQG